ncbi:MAG: 23S rRNA (guanosine(2251)-2'-O)-methyltransferase RlmB [Gammaproteobacteria bacterium]|nr:23S rRNA (guanosine(2251)-2'-O)-methyltransferase RlmB [Gammaproteobacteria bacterium]MDH5729196.1 23S rRNA (guanosine(2251)-2'-O)-methyltransferase RlmB [Gammaproteobacteria bacterium]
MSEMIYGVHTVRAVLQKDPSNIFEVLLQDSRDRNQRINEIEALANQNNIPIRYLPRRQLDDLVDGARHQGVIAQSRGMTSLDEAFLENLISQQAHAPLLLILDGIQDPHNLGACLRTADAVGVDAVIAPKDKSVGLTPVVRKTAVGAAETIPFVQVTNLARTIKRLQELGVWISGASANADQTLYDLDFTGASAIVIGAEGKGLRRLTEEHCDYLMKIPMQGSVESLNASVAAAVCLFEARRQRLTK